MSENKAARQGGFYIYINIQIYLEFRFVFWYNEKNVSERKIKMKAVVTVVGHDAKGIIAKVSAKCAEAGANIIDISQSVLGEYFAMIMVIEIADLNCGFTEFANGLGEIGKAENLDIRAMHESIFDAMHKI